MVVKRTSAYTSIHVQLGCLHERVFGFLMLILILLLIQTTLGQILIAKN